MKPRAAAASRRGPYAAASRLEMRTTAARCPPKPAGRRPRTRRRRAAERRAARRPAGVAPPPQSLLAVLQLLPRRRTLRLEQRTPTHGSPHGRRRSAPSGACPHAGSPVGDRTVASPNPAEAKSRAGTEADLLLTPFRPERPPFSVEHVIYRSNREEFVMSQRHRFQAIAALACAIAAASALEDLQPSRHRPRRHVSPRCRARTAGSRSSARRQRAGSDLHHRRQREGRTADHQTSNRRGGRPARLVAGRVAARLPPDGNPFAIYTVKPDGRLHCSAPVLGVGPWCRVEV